MELRPRPWGRQYKGWARVGVRRWIKDPAERIVIPDRIKKMEYDDYIAARKESEAHRSAVKDNPSRPEQLDSGFFEPEIFTVRSLTKAHYLQRHPDMMEPTMNGQNRSNRSKRNLSPASSLSADIAVAVKMEGRIQNHKKNSDYD